LTQSPLSPHLASPAELQQRIATEREGVPFLVYREPDAGQQLVRIARDRATAIGRNEDCDVCLHWDERVSRLHAEITRVAGEWVAVDDGLSRNGSYVNGERVVGRRRLSDGDQLQVGDTLIIFRDPVQRQQRSTARASGDGRTPELSQAHHRVLVALCRPLQAGDLSVAPATNQQIADELFLSVSGVKTHLRALAQTFGLGELPTNEKRRRLARLALERGVVTPADLDR
jgi:pSer/pThr/pTyr-binding forkhead associated (FHA) protein